MSNEDLSKLVGLMPSRRDVYDVARKYVEAYEAKQKRIEERRAAKQVGKKKHVIRVDRFPSLMEDLANTVSLVLENEKFSVTWDEIEFEENMNEAIDKGFLDPRGRPFPEVDE